MESKPALPDSAQEKYKSNQITAHSDLGEAFEQITKRDMTFVWKLYQKDIWHLRLLALRVSFVSASEGKKSPRHNLFSVV
jgi:hypothetical protein